MGCRRVAPAADLERVVVAPDGTLGRGRSGSGRGAWLCRSVDCVDRAARRQAFARALRTPLAPDAVASLRADFAGRARMDGRFSAAASAGAGQNETPTETERD